MIAERGARSSAGWRFAALASLLVLALQAGGPALRLALQYERTALQAGEWYRLVTGHWVHLDWGHALLNVAGLWLLALLDPQPTPLRVQALRCVMLSVAIGLAFYGWQPGLQWYAGLSGVLHGLFVIVLVQMLYRRADPLAALVLALLIGKLAWEHYHGALTQGLLRMPVIVAAHSYGALAGFGYAVLARLALRARRGQAHNPRD